VRGVAELVGAFVGDDFEVVETIDPAIELWPIDPKDGIPLHFLPRESRMTNVMRYWPSPESGSGTRAALRVGLGVPTFDFGFFRHALVGAAVADAFDDDLAGTVTGWLSGVRVRTSTKASFLG